MGVKYPNFYVNHREREWWVNKDISGANRNNQKGRVLRRKSLCYQLLPKWMPMIVLMEAGSQ